jgi:hypothetical protein
MKQNVENGTKADGDARLFKDAGQLQVTSPGFKCSLFMKKVTRSETEIQDEVICAGLKQGEN